MGRDPSVQLLSLIICPFPLLNSILHDSCQPLLWHCRLAFNLMSGFCAQALLGGRGGRWGDNAASPSGFCWALGQDTSVVGEGFWALLELRKAEVSSHTSVISPSLIFGCILPGSHLLVLLLRMGQREAAGEGQRVRPGEC